MSAKALGAESTNSKQIMMNQTTNFKQRQLNLEIGKLEFGICLGFQI